MKKIIAIALAVLLAASLYVSASAENDVYALLTGLLNGREVTLTVTAENVEGVEDFFAPYGTFTCTVKQEDDVITLNVTTEGEAFLKAEATAENVTLSTNFIEMEDVVTTWETLAPNVTVTRDEGSAALKLGMTGPNMELINFTVKVKGTDLSDYDVEVSIAFITGPGAVYSVWDTVSGQEGSTARDFAFTWDADELYIEANGSETITDDDGLTIDRADECTVCLDDDEIGTLTFHSVLTVR